MPEPGGEDGGASPEPTRPEGRLANRSVRGAVWSTSIGRGWIRGRAHSLAFDPDLSQASQAIYQSAYDGSGLVLNLDFSTQLPSTDGLRLGRGWIRADSPSEAHVDPDLSQPPRAVYFGLHPFNTGSLLGHSLVPGGSASFIGNGWIRAVGNRTFFVPSSG